MRDVEFVAARLYTGPLFEKYCAVLRGIPGFSAFLTNKMHTLCMGNNYCATIHAINDALIDGLREFDPPVKRTRIGRPGFDERLASQSAAFAMANHGSGCDSSADPDQDPGLQPDEKIAATGAFAIGCDKR